MRKYLPPKCEYTIYNNGILTDGSFHGKITGTMMAGILGCSPFSSPFRVACDLLGLCKEDISDKPSVKAGKLLEEKVIEYLGEKYETLGLFIPAEQLFAPREGDHDEWPSDFDDDTFAGHLDGMVMTPDGQSYVLEIKTTSNLRSWENGVPEYYWWQVALYNHFVAKQDKAYVAVALLTPEEQAHPEDWTPNDDNVVLYSPPMDDLKALVGIGKAIDWYKAFVMMNTTPQMDPNDARDCEMHAYLMSLTNSKEAMSAMLDMYANLTKEIDMAHLQVKGKESARDDIKARMKEWMEIHSIYEIPSLDGKYIAILATTTKSTVDPELMRRAGIDPTPYMVEKSTSTFRVKQI